MLLRVLIYCILSSGFFLNVYAKPSLKDLQNEALSLKAQKVFLIKEPQKLEFKGKKYKIFIALSKNYKPNSSLKAFYVLDGNKHFVLLLNGLARLNFRANEPFIIIGIGYDTSLGYDQMARKRDYTPKISLEFLQNATNTKTFENSGKEAEFWEFLQDILLTKINKTYPQIRTQALFGHSFGGLFVLNALLKHPLIFDAYFIVSPSLWWGEGSFLPNKIALATCPKIFFLRGKMEKTRGKSSMSLTELHEKISKQCEANLKEFAGLSHSEVIPYALIFAFKNFVN